MKKLIIVCVAAMSWSSAAQCQPCPKDEVVAFLQLGGATISPAAMRAATRYCLRLIRMTNEECAKHPAEFCDKDGCEKYRADCATSSTFKGASRGLEFDRRASAEVDRFFRAAKRR